MKSWSNSIGTWTGSTSKNTRPSSSKVESYGKEMTDKEFGEDFYCVDSVAVNHGTSIRIIPKDFRKRNLTLPPRGKGRPRNGIGKALDLPYILANSQGPAQVLALDEDQNYNSSDDSDYVSEARDDQSDMSDSDDDDDFDHEAPLMQQRDDEVHSV